MKSYFLVMGLVLLAAPCAASNRDHEADLLTISTRFIATYTRTPHKAGDIDGQFIEDVVIPAVDDVVTSGDGRLSDEQLNAAIEFIIESDSLSSEAIGDIALTIYKSQKVRLCTSISQLAKPKRTIVLDRVKSGMTAIGKKAPHVIC